MPIREKTKAEIEDEKRRFLDILQSRGIQAAREAYIDMLNDENRRRYYAKLPQNAEKVNPVYAAVNEVIESYREALQDKDELFREFVMNHKAFKKWLSQQEDK